VMYHHDLTVLNGALLCVASLGRALDMNLDHHRAGALCAMCPPCTLR
jgi:hypothetical protein